MKQHAAPQPRAAQAPKGRAPAPSPQVTTEAAQAAQEAIRDILRADSREEANDAGGAADCSFGDGDGDVGDGVGLIRRACRACDEEELRRAPSPHGPHGSARGGTVDPALGRDIKATRPSGRPLPGGLRQGFEKRFAAPFHGVRIVTGEPAARLNDSLHARAFTVGNHIWFGRGEFQPESPAGRRLLAHELAHTLQPGSHEGGDMEIGAVDAPEERQADLMADAVLRGEAPARPAKGTPALRRTPGTGPGWKNQTGANAGKTTVGAIQRIPIDALDLGFQYQPGNPADGPSRWSPMASTRRRTRTCSCISTATTRATLKAPAAR